MFYSVHLNALNVNRGHCYVDMSTFSTCSTSSCVFRHAALINLLQTNK
jgi:hypothetical protein